MLKSICIFNFPFIAKSLCRQLVMSNDKKTRLKPVIEINNHACSKCALKTFKTKPKIHYCLVVLHSDTCMHGYVVRRVFYQALHKLTTPRV